MLYSLASQQLSKQDHYDYGLRALVSVLRYAGRKRRLTASLSDEEVSIWFVYVPTRKYFFFHFMKTQK